MKYSQFEKWRKKVAVDLAFYFHPQDSIHYKIAETEEEKTRIYRLRYKTYIEELGREPPGIDHEQKIIKEELDDLPYSFQFYQEEDNEVVVAMRVSIFPPGAMPADFKDVYSLNKYGWADDYTWCDVSYAIVSSNLRSKMHYAKFLLSIFSQLMRNIQFILGSCKPYLLNRYLLLGGNVYSQHMIHSPDGIQIPLIWIVDAEEAKKISSPFRNLACLQSNIILKEHIDEINHAETGVIFDNEEILKEIDTMKMLNPTLKHFDNLAFEYLLDNECFVIDINKPVKVVHKEMKDKTMYLLLVGRADLFMDNARIRLEPGSLIGEFSYFEHVQGDAKHEVDVICEYGKILVINKSALTKLARQHPVEYIKFMHFAMKSMMDKTFLLGNLSQAENVHV